MKNYVLNVPRTACHGLHHHVQFSRNRVVRAHSQNKCILSTSRQTLRRHMYRKLRSVGHITRIPRGV